MPPEPPRRAPPCRTLRLRPLEVAGQQGWCGPVSDCSYRSRAAVWGGDRLAGRFCRSPRSVSPDLTTVPSSRVKSPRRRAGGSTSRAFRRHPEDLGLLLGFYTKLFGAEDRGSCSASVSTTSTRRSAGWRRVAKANPGAGAAVVLLHSRFRPPERERLMDELNALGVSEARKSPGKAAGRRRSSRQGGVDGTHGARGVQRLLHADHHPGEAGAPPTGTPRHSQGMRNSNSGRSHGTAGGFASAVPVRTAPTRW